MSSGPRRLSRPVDGSALFAQACAISGLMAGWSKVAANAGAAGGDRVTIPVFAANLDQRLIRLSQALREGSYRPGPLRHVAIPKASGGTRRLAIPCIADRVAQSAVAQALSPALEEEFEDASYGYRPGRGVADAVRRVEALRRQGFVWTLDADIEAYFDTIPIDRLSDRLARVVTESPLLALVGLWLEHGAVMGRGLPQGSPLSPLLANLYLDELDEALFRDGLRIVRYADDFVVLAKDRPDAEAAQKRAEAVLKQAGLRLNPGKTAIRGYDDSLRFLGHVFIRGWAVKSEEEADPFADALRRVAETDREAERAIAGEEEQLAAGYDRGLRLLHVRGKGRALRLRNQSFSVHAAPEELVPGASPELAAIHATRLDRIELGPSVEADFDTLRHALAHAIPVAFVNGHGDLVGQLAPALSPHAGRHLAQARHHLDPALRLDLARAIVGGRIANQRSLLRRLNHRRGLATVARCCVALTGILRRLAGIADLDTLRGWEGAATKLYWRAWNELLLNGFTLPRRVRRQAQDPVNIALDMTAGLLIRDMAAIVLSTGLHPGFGTLHATSDLRDACVYDLVEEFRAGLCESVVLTSLNGKRIAPDDFSRLPDGRWHMARDAGDALIRAYEDRCERPVLVPRLGRRMSWRRLMRAQAELYAAHVEGRATYEPYVLDN